MGAIFWKKGKEMLKKGKTFENVGKNIQNFKIILKKGQVSAYDNCMQ